MDTPERSSEVDTNSTVCRMLVAMGFGHGAEDVIIRGRTGSGEIPVFIYHGAAECTVPISVHELDRLLDDPAVYGQVDQRIAEAVRTLKAQ